jgi:hypothetical protein
MQELHALEISNSLLITRLVAGDFGSSPPTDAREQIVDMFSPRFCLAGHELVRCRIVY